MIANAWMYRFNERCRRDPRHIECLDIACVFTVMGRLEEAHESSDTASARRWLHAAQVAIAACAPSHAEEMRRALGDVVGLLGLDDTHTEEG